MAKRKNPAAVALASQRMVKMTPEERQAVSKAGGTARAKKVPKKRRSEIAKKAAAARWKKDGPKK